MPNCEEEQITWNSNLLITIGIWILPVGLSFFIGPHLSKEFWVKIGYVPYSLNVVALILGLIIVKNFREELYRLWNSATSIWSSLGCLPLYWPQFQVSSNYA
jgi:hypothetical protein